LDKSWKKVEKGIAIIGILFGAVMLTIFIYSCSTTLFQLVEDEHTTWDKISTIHFLRGQFPNLILNVLSIISGGLLLKSLKTGWITSILNWILQASFLLWTIFKADGDLFVESNKEFLIMICIILLLLLIIPILHVQKPFREKYI
jgi:hypothetical protein